MKLKVFSLRFLPEQGGFDDRELQEFLMSREVISVTEQFFVHESTPWWAVMVTYREVSGEQRPRRSMGSSVAKVPPSERKERKDWRATLDPVERPVYDSLRRWRSDRAHREGMPPYLILTNQQLAEIVQARPISLTGLRDIEKIGEGKAKHFEQNRVKRRSVKEDVSHVFILEGLLRCGSCGSAMSPNHSRSKGKKYFYYQCTAVNHKGAEACEVKRIWAKNIEPLVMQNVEEFAKQPDVLENLIEAANQAAQEEVAPISREKHVLEGQLAEVKRKGRGLVDQISEGELRNNEFVQDELNNLEIRSKQLRGSIKQLDDQISAAESRVVNAEVVKEALTRFAEIFDSLTPDVQKELVRYVVKEMVYTPEALRISLFERDDIEVRFGSESCRGEGLGVMKKALE